MFKGTEHSSREASCAKFPTLSWVSAAAGDDSASPVEGSVTAVVGGVPWAVKAEFDCRQVSD